MDRATFYKLGRGAKNYLKWNGLRPWRTTLVSENRMLSRRLRN